MSSMPRTARFLGIVSDWSVLLTLFLLPLFFSHSTLDSLELAKQSLLGFLAAVALMAWLGKALAEKDFRLTYHWLHVIVAVFGVGYVLIAWLSQDQYLSFVGRLGQMSWSGGTLVALVLLYSVIADRWRTPARTYQALFIFLLSSAGVGGYGLWQLSRHQAFNSIGSVFSLAVYMVVPLVVASALAFHGFRRRDGLFGLPAPAGRITRGLLWLVMALALAILILVNFWAAWAALLFGLILMVGIDALRARALHRHRGLFLPVGLAAIAILFLIFPSPWRLSLPGEVSPSAKASWQIAQRVLQDHPLVGSGPGTWIYDHALNRVQAVNQSPFWATRFDRGLSSFLTLLPTIGIVGAALWLILLISVLAQSGFRLIHERDDEAWYAYLTVFSAWATMALVGFLYNYNMAHQVVFWLFLALVGGLAAREGWKWDTRTNAYASSALSAVFIVAAVGAFSVLWLTGQRLIADVRFSQGVSAFQAGKSVDEAIPFLVRARELNPWNDLYARSLAQAYLVRITNVIQDKPTPERVQAVNGDVVKAVDLALAATERGPSNVDNWSTLALIYQTVMPFTKGADEFAIKNYQRAHALEPQNPIFLTEIGKIYLQRAENERPLLEARDDKAKAEAQKRFDEAARQAVAFLRQAITAKPDYFPARYHLGVAYERQGKLEPALAELEQALRGAPDDVGIQFELAILSYRAGQNQRAVTLLEGLVRADPNRANARWYLSAVYEELGRMPEALVQLESLAKQLPGNTAVSQRLATLRNRVRGAAASTLPEPLKEEAPN